MKKSLIVLAVALMTLAGCQNQVALQSISIKPNAIDKMYVGDTTVLALVLNPKEAAMPENVVWESSDAEVIEIIDQKGRVAAVAPGSAIVTVKAGELTAACRITANYYELFWNIDWLYYFPSTTSAPVNDSIYTADGKPCTLHTVTFFCPNNNDFDENLTSGKGTCLFADVSVLCYKDSVDKDGNPVLVSQRRSMRLVDTEEEWLTEPYTALKGQINAEEVGKIFDEFLAAYAAGDASASVDWEAYLANAKGAHLNEAEITSSGSISYTTAPFDALVSGEATCHYESQLYLTYDVTVDWLGGLWGIAEDPDAVEEDPTTWLLQPYEVYSYATVHYTSESEVGELIFDAPQRRAAAAKAVVGQKKNLGKPVRYIVDTNKVTK